MFASVFINLSSQRRITNGECCMTNNGLPICQTFLIPSNHE
jgi:hypothetical protein